MAKINNEWEELINKYKSDDVYGEVIEIESEMGVYPLNNLIKEILEEQDIKYRSVMKSQLKEHQEALDRLSDEL